MTNVKQCVTDTWFEKIGLKWEVAEWFDEITEMINWDEIDFDKSEEEIKEIVFRETFCEMIGLRISKRKIFSQNVDLTGKVASLPSSVLYNFTFNLHLDKEDQLKMFSSYNPLETDFREEKEFFYKEFPGYEMKERMGVTDENYLYEKLEDYSKKIIKDIDLEQLKIVLIENIVGPAIQEWRNLNKKERKILDSAWK